ncbi:response regulator transcription factor [Glycomyces harbinensis]|uniref:Two-component system, NarL family, response regulator DesR n=1 Tax=Glycomyces harbinensis TaxID=58114 RepID=A0A1G6RJ45_9ACTN|nr:response regulator transcription factor [Glycomyces harbinensis]SDD04670.1 two-component system, NarL family, response regulator DesR [Glycomyces harbinensis]
MIRVLLKHDKSLWRTALARGLDKAHGITVVADLDCDEDVIAAASRMRPHILVHEAGLLPSETLTVLCEALPETGVLLLIDPGRSAGVLPDLTWLVPRVGVMTTDATFEGFVEAIHRLSRGEAVLDARVAVAALRARANPLTPREQEVLGLILTGATTRDIADKLFLEVGTVRNYLSNAIHKSGARSRIDAVRIAQEAGWI